MRKHFVGGLVRIVITLGFRKLKHSLLCFLGMLQLLGEDVSRMLQKY